MYDLHFDFSTLLKYEINQNLIDYQVYQVGKQSQENRRIMILNVYVSHVIPLKVRHRQLLCILQWFPCRSRPFSFQNIFHIDRRGLF